MELLPNSIQVVPIFGKISSKTSCQLIVPAEFLKRSYLFWSFQEMEEATEVDMAATALLSDTPIQVSVSEN